MIWKYKYALYLIVINTIFIFSCANQLPPSGGMDDKIPPKIISIYPVPNTVNFKDSKIRFQFDEYVDRRSFEESFFISPKPKGETTFNWSGKGVEVEFSKPLDRNKTYVVVIGKDLKDLRGGNNITAPLNLAFSTGEKIDKGSISGKVYADNTDRVKILAFLTNGVPENSLDPAVKLPDYIIQITSDGMYKLTNLPEGDYRIFAITDEDRSNLFDKNLDKIAVLRNDIKINSDSNRIEEVNFLLKDPDLIYDKDFLSQLKPDSVNYVYSNISDNQSNIPPDYKFYFYFRRNTLSKADIVNNFSLTDTAVNKSYRLVFNWINDSLAEIFPTEKLALASSFKINIRLTGLQKYSNYSIRFSTAGRNNFGKVSGKVFSKGTLNSPVSVRLYSKENRFINYSAKISDTAEFRFEQVLEGNYTLFSFIDENDNGRFDKGNYFPFKPSEKFIIYTKDIAVKGGWNVENIFLNY